jgi:hypothetical protein
MSPSALYFDTFYFVLLFFSVCGGKFVSLSIISMMMRLKTFRAILSTSKASGEGFLGLKTENGVFFLDRSLSRLNFLFFLLIF